MIDLEKFDINKLHNDFINAEPFNHIIIDNFFNSNYLDEVLEEIKSLDETLDEEYNRREKDYIEQSKKIGLSEYNRFGNKLKSLIDFSKSNEMIKFIENITGIDNIQDDPELYGGGIHRTKRGGRLAIHADFNLHPNTGKHRRINILLYLNKDWKPEYNGELELWNKDMNKCFMKIPPIFNRLVLFRITDTAYHGHPEYWMAPENISRLSIALYYYTDDRPENEKSNFHMALWKERNIDGKIIL
jgi:Rps23 Pro-64 3,4-dihydroxylase Tpa1-like proline 4-hydroxylase